MQILTSTPKTRRAFKVLTAISFLIAVTDLVSRSFGQSTQPDSYTWVLVRSLFIIAAGVLLACGRRYFLVTSGEHKALLALGLGYIALGTGKLSTIGSELILMPITLDCVAATLFVLGFVRITKG